MKILMLNYEYPPLGGGAANAMFYMLREFAKDPSLKIDVVTASPGKIEVDHISKNITLYRLDVNKKSFHYQTNMETLRWSVETARFIPGLMKKSRYDLMHCWFGWPSGYFGYINRKKIPYIISLRGSDVPGFNPRLRLLDRIVFTPYSKVIWSKARRVTANSQGLKELAEKTWSGNIEIIYNGVDTDEFRPGEKKAHPKVLRLVSVGRLIQRKGYDKLLDGLSRESGYTLTLIGEGNEEENLKRQAKSLGVSVSFLGKLDHEDIIKEMHKADVFVLPSMSEGMSNSMLEAMACGLPVLVPDVGGTKELVKGNGFIVDDFTDLKILKKYKEPLIISAQGAKSREIAEKMSWANAAGRYKALYKEVGKDVFDSPEVRI